ncbi:MAG: hypothetical protein WC314_26150 [Vulcanimicrobiota bacterium]
MAINKAGINNFQAKIDQANFAKTRTVTAEQGLVAAQNSGRTSEKSKTTETPGEKLTLSANLQAQMAKEQQTLSDDIEQARAGMADEANQAHTDKKAKEKDRKIGESRVEQKKEARTFFLDDGTDESYKVTESQGKKLDVLDDRSPEQILEGMPDHAKAAAKATLTSQIETKGMKKVSQLKDDPKVSAQVEDMKLDLADTKWMKNTLAPIRGAEHEPALQLDDPHAETMAKDLAMRQMQDGGGEQLLAG